MGIELGRRQGEKGMGTNRVDVAAEVVVGLG